MTLKTRPLNNNVLLEVQREYEGVSRSDENESIKSGILVSSSNVGWHLTASSAAEFDGATVSDIKVWLRSLVGKTVRWEEFAEGGQTFQENGKTYALVPWWRLISVTEPSETEETT